MNTVKRNILVSASTIVLTFFVSSGLQAQEELPPMPDLSFEETVRMQIENMMMKDTMLIMSPYDKDIALYKFPSKLLASGMGDVKNYWKKHAQSEDMVDYEFLESTAVGDFQFARVRKMDHTAATQDITFILFQFKGKRITSIYFF